MTDQFGAEPDERAIRTLFATYWSPQGWVDDPSTPPEELSHAVEAGVMFEPATTEATHDEVVEAVIAARDRVEEDQVRAAFLHSLTSRRLELRSALGSFAVARHLALHPHDPDASRYCTVCGRLPDAAAIDRNVMSFERLKWGGVRHDQLEYVAFDLERFALADHPQATAEDRALHGRLLDELDELPAGATAATAAKGSLRELKGNAQERAVLLDILGLCSVLETAEHRGYAGRFVPYAERELPGKRFVERSYPACWWTGADGVNRAAAP